MTRLRSLLRVLRGRQSFENDMAEEVRFHLEEYARDLQDRGVAPDEARRRARLELGSLDTVKDDCRQARGLRFFDELQQDLRLAMRSTCRAPGFTATALAIVAFGLGTNLTLFAVVDAVLLRALPFAHGERLVRVFNTYPKAGVLDDGSSITNYYERRGQVPALGSLAVYREGSAVVGPLGATARERILQVSPEFFATLGTGPVLGRAFTEEETLTGADGVVILSDAYWRQRLDADPHVIGRVVRVDGLDRKVAGVLPPDFAYLSSSARLYLPYNSHPDQRVPARRHWGSSSQMIGRLAPGAAPPEAQAQIDVQNTSLESDNPDGRRMADAGFRTLVVPLRADHVAAVRPVVLMVLAGGLVLLLIGAVNLTNLLLIRASGQAKELAVRQALGAGRGRLVRTVVTETLLLTLGGGLLGLGMAAGGVSLLKALGIGLLPLGASIRLDTRVGFAGLLGALALGIATGVLVAWHNLADAPDAPLHSERGGTANRATLRLRHGFLVAQIALAFVLLSGAGSLALSLRRAMEVSPGFRPQQLLSGHLALPWKSYPDHGKRLAFIERLLDAVEQRAGVRGAGVMSNVPLSGNTIKNAVTLEGRAVAAGTAPRGHYAYGVGGDALVALGLRLVEGRLLDADDSRHAERVCVVDEDFARHYWPDGRVLGQRLFHGGRAGAPGEAFTVVGVVGAVKQASLTDATPQGAVYYPYGYWQADGGFSSWSCGPAWLQSRWPEPSRTPFAPSIPICP